MTPCSKCGLSFSCRRLVGDVPKYCCAECYCSSCHAVIGRCDCDLCRCSSGSGFGLRTEGSAPRAFLIRDTHDSAVGAAHAMKDWAICLDSTRALVLYCRPPLEAREQTCQLTQSVLITRRNSGLILDSTQDLVPYEHDITSTRGEYLWIMSYDMYCASVVHGKD